MTRIFFSVLLSAFLCAHSAHALSLKDDVVGAWALESFRAGQPDGTEIDWCLNPTGLLIYTETGFMSVGINCDKNTPPNGPSQEAGHRLFYTGRYEIDADRGAVVHHVVNSSLEKFLGKDLVRLATLNGDQLVLFTVGEKRNTLKWKKLAL